MADAEAGLSRQELILCQTCLLDEVTTDATGYCVDCVERLCDSCVKDHRRNKASRKHDVLTVVDDNSKLQVLHCLNEIFRCKAHPDLDVEKYCEDHKRYVCSVCLSTTHQSCKLTEGCKTSSDFTLVAKLFDDIENEFAKFRQNRKANECQIRDACETVSCKRKVLVEKLRRQVDEIDKTLESETELLLQSEIDNLRTDLKDCDDMEGRQRALMNIMASVKERGLTKKDHVLSHEMENMLRAMKENILKRKLTRVEFVETANDLVSLGKMKSVSYSEVGLKRSEVELSSACADGVEEDKTTAADTADSSDLRDVQADGHTERHEQQKQLVPLSKGNCTLFRKYNLGKEKAMTIVTAIVSLQNGSFVVADKGNKMLKVFTGEDNPAYTVACDFSPLSMCMRHVDEVAVIFSDTNRIQRYHLSTSNVFKNGQFFCGKKCRDITSCNDDIALLVHDDLDYEIEIRRVSNGQVLKCIRKFTGISESDIELENPPCFIYLQTEASFLVGEDCKVHSFSEEGNELWFYKQYQRDNKIDTITGLAADDEDNVYVCCQGSENVHQVSAKNFRQHRVILSKMADVKTIAFDKSEKRMYVGCAGCDEISCYTFV